MAEPPRYVSVIEEMRDICKTCKKPEGILEQTIKNSTAFFDKQSRNSTNPKTADFHLYNQDRRMWKIEHLALFKIFPWSQYGFPFPGVDPGDLRAQSSTAEHRQNRGDTQGAGPTNVGTGAKQLPKQVPVATPSNLRSEPSSILRTAPTNMDTRAESTSTMDVVKESTPVMSRPPAIAATKTTAKDNPQKKELSIKEKKRAHKLKQLQIRFEDIELLDSDDEKDLVKAAKTISEKDNFQPPDYMAPSVLEKWLKDYLEVISLKRKWADVDEEDKTEMEAKQRKAKLQNVVRDHENKGLNSANQKEKEKEKEQATSQSSAKELDNPETGDNSSSNAMVLYSQNEASME